MNFLEERIARDGVVKPGNVLKVDSFLNHQLDVALLDQIGEEFKRRFADVPVTKVLTIEASGIAMAYPVARAFGFTTIGLTEYAISMGLAFLVIPVVELVKLVQRAIAKSKK